MSIVTTLRVIKSDLATSTHSLTMTQLRGPQGPAGPAGGGGSGGFNFTQATASATWTINHNLGYRPDVALFTVGGVNFSAEVSHPTVNQAVVTLVSPLAGSARLS